MRQCRYCDTELMFVGECEKRFYWYCRFCDLIFDESDTNRENEKISPVSAYDDNYYRTVKELMSCRIFDLLYSLKRVRGDCWTVNQTLKKLVTEQKEKGEISGEINQVLSDEYRQLNKIRKTIEIITLDRIGYIPKKISDKFMNDLLALHEESIKAKN